MEYITSAFSYQVRALCPQLIYLLPQWWIIGGLNVLSPSGWWLTVVLLAGEVPGAPTVVLAGGEVDCALTMCCCTARKFCTPAYIRNISSAPNATGIIYCCLFINQNCN